MTEHDHRRPEGEPTRRAGGSPHGGTRKWSRIPKEIPPHPNSSFGGLPPCEAGSEGPRPCKRDASKLYMGLHVCEEHLKWYLAEENLDQAEGDVYHARRMLWRAQVEDVPTLEHHLTQALIDVEGHEREAKKRYEEAREKASEEGGS